MGNCKGKLSKSEKNKFREDAYVKNIDRNEIDHGKNGPPKTDVDENKENSTHAKISTKPVNTINHDKDRPPKTDVDENKENSTHAKISTKPVNTINHDKDRPPKTDVDENKENSTHAKISTKPVNTIDHDKDRLTVHKKADTDEHEETNKMSAESNIIEHAQDGLMINQHRIVSNNSDPSTSSLESKNQHENNVPEIKDTIFKTENSGDNLICTEENSRPCKKDTNVAANETHVIIEPTNGMNKEQKDTTKKNQDPITQIQTETKKKNQDPILQQKNGNENRTNDDEASVVTPDLNVNTGDIHCTDMDLDLNFGETHGTGLSLNTGDKNETGLSLNTGDKNGTGLSQTTGDKRRTDSSQNTGDKHGTDLSQNTGDKHRTDLSQNTGDKNGTGLSQNTGDKRRTDSSQNTGDKHETDLRQNTGDKHGTETNKIDVGNPTTMPEVPDMNTSNKTLKGGEVTQNKDQNNPADKTDGDDNEDTTGYESAKYAKRIDDKDKKSGTKSTKKGKKKKIITNKTDIHLGDMNTPVMNIGCKLGNVNTKIRNPAESRTEVVNIACTIDETNTEIIYDRHQPPDSPGEEATPQLDMKIMKVLTEVSNSIGMFDGKLQGSCWRAGTDLIVTAWHVVLGHIREYEDLKYETLTSVKIKFDYTGSDDWDESNIFEVEPEVLYRNETLDTAILRLKPNGKVVTFPPPFRRLNHFLIPAEDEDLTIYLIGHPDRSPQRVNLEVGLWNPTDERMQSLETFCRDKGYEYEGYAELDKTERLVVKCEFEDGASGCPGVVVLGDNQVYLVTMFLKGFPDFYCSRQFKGKKKKMFPKSKLFQQGVNIGAIYEDMKKNPMYADIFEDIFIKQTQPVNTGPSGIIPSENYSKGYQDCHSSVNTSTQPTSDEMRTCHVTSPCQEETSDEGTCHVTSPCQKETSDEGTCHVTSPCQEETSDEGTRQVTSPCQEETNENVTVEKQGSQMVVSGQ